MRAGAARSQVSWRPRSRPWSGLAPSEAFFRPGDRAGHAFFDLPGYIGSRLAAAGLGEHEILGHCTYTEEDLFFSYRRATHRGEPDYGRLISAIALTP